MNDLKKMKRAALLCIWALALLPVVGLAQSPRTVYVFGVASELNDTVVFLTSVQPLQDAQLQKRTGFLLGRSLYAAQMKDYLAKQGTRHGVCVVYFSKSQKKMEKRHAKFLNEYRKDNATELRELKENQFQFQSVGLIGDNRARLNDPTVPEEAGE